MTIAVDFDGTLVDHAYPKIGKEKPFAFEVLRMFQDEGHTLILWTVREGELLEDAVKYCESKGIRFYAVNSNYPEGSYTEAPVSRKINADVFIDDSNVGGLPEWMEIYSTVSKGKRLKVDQHHSGRHGHHGHRRKFRLHLFSDIAERCRQARGRLSR